MERKIPDKAKLFQASEKKEPTTETLETIYKWLGGLTLPAGSELEKLIKSFHGGIFHPLQKPFPNRDVLLDARFKCHELREKIRQTSNDSQATQSVEVLTNLIDKIEKLPEVRNDYIPPLVNLYEEKTYKMR
jgi:hypothetical protein